MEENEYTLNVTHGDFIDLTNEARDIIDEMNSFYGISVNYSVGFRLKHILSMTSLSLAEFRELSYPERVFIYDAYYPCEV